MAKVLVVDDSPMMRKILRQIFTSLNHEVVSEAENGVDAYLQYEQYMPDLVTMDIQMPQMEGIDSLREIIKKFPKANVVMVSSVDSKEKVFEAIRLGAKGYILKPLEKAKVISAINDIMKKCNLI
jgi:two-component system, chemotaxis family, chemotaxis protein CheY